MDQLQSLHSSNVAFLYSSDSVYSDRWFYELVWYTGHRCLNWVKLLTWHVSLSFHPATSDKSILDRSKAHTVWLKASCIGLLSKLTSITKKEHCTQIWWMDTHWCQDRLTTLSGICTRSIFMHIRWSGGILWHVLPDTNRCFSHASHRGSFHALVLNAKPSGCLYKSPKRDFSLYLLHLLCHPLSSHFNTTK